MRAIIAITAFALSTSAAFAQFAVDLSPAEIRRATGNPAVIDLAIGEVGLLNYINVCEKDGRLMLYAGDQLADSRSEYGLTFEVRKEPGGTVAIQSYVGASSSASPEEYFGGKFSVLVPCFAPVWHENLLIPVSTVDGATSVSAALAH